MHNNGGINTALEVLGNTIERLHIELDATRQALEEARQQQPAHGATPPPPEKD